MEIQRHLGQGAVVICDYDGFRPPEMVKRRPVIVLCKPMSGRSKVCTVVPLSTTAPNPVMPFHAEISLPFALPPPFTAPKQWVKADMVNVVSFARLDLFRAFHPDPAERKYLLTPIGDELLRVVQLCLLKSLSLTGRDDLLTS